MKVLAFLTLILISSCAKRLEKNNVNSRLIISDQSSSPQILSEELEVQTKLKQAIKTSSLNLVRTALKRGAKPDLVMIGQETALTYSIKNHYNFIASTLVNSGADTDLANSYNETPLHIAITNNDAILTRILLSKKKTNIDRPYNSGETPLIRAIRQKNKRIALMLIRANADLEIRSPSGDLVENIAYQNLNERIAILIERLRKFNNNLTRVDTIRKIINDKDTFTLNYIKNIHQEKNLRFGTKFLKQSIINEDDNFSKEIINTFFSISKIPVYTQYLMLIETIKNKNLDLIKHLYQILTYKDPNFYDNEDRTLLSYAVESLKYKSALFFRKKGSETYFKTREDKVINSCNFLNKRRLKRKSFRSFKNMLGC